MNKHCIHFEMLILLTLVMLSGILVSAISILLIWVKVSEVSNITSVPIASFQPLQSTMHIQCTISCPF